MNRNELPRLTDRLAELAEVLGGKPPSAKAAMVWLDALAECQIDDVLAVLTDWPKSNSRMPLPADILNRARNRLSDRIERLAEENKKNAPKWSEMMTGLRENLSPAAINARAELAAWAATAKSKARDHKAWAKKLKADEEAGKPLLYVQQQAWRKALRIKETDAQKEARIEREAIVNQEV